MILQRVATDEPSASKLLEQSIFKKNAILQMGMFLIIVELMLSFL